MTFIIKNIHNLSTQERQEIVRFLTDIFSDNKEYAACVYTGKGLELCILAYENNQLIGHAGITRRSVSHKGKLYQVGGIGDVAVAEKYWKLGVGKLLMQKTAKVLQENQFDLGLLFCHPDLFKFYSSCDWIEKEKGLIFATTNGIKEDQMFTCYLPISLDSNSLINWSNDDIDVGTGGW